jgi:high-affinity iron transporter
MLATIIIVLREMLEVCLITGIISTTLKELKERKIILLSALAFGATLSAIIILSLTKITVAFDGRGQEILAIITLSISILCIAWTVVWLNNSGKKLQNKIIDAKLKLENRELTIWPIIFIIALAISREGAELALFMHGIYLTGASVDNMIYGVIIGSLAGISIGVFTYIGLLKISQKYFFRVINILFILLAAGMSSQLATYLNAAEIIDSFSSNMWDSSWLLNDNQILGKILYSVIGYSSHPSQLQVLMYIFTIVAITVLIKYTKKRR